MEGYELALDDIVSVIFFAASFTAPVPVVLRELPDDKTVELDPDLALIRAPVEVLVYGERPSFSPVLRVRMDEPEEPLLAWGTTEVPGDAIADYQYTFYDDDAFYAVLALPEEQEDSASVRRGGMSSDLEATFHTALAEIGASANPANWFASTPTFIKRESSTAAGRFARFDRIAVLVHGILNTVATFEGQQLDEHLKEKLATHEDDITGPTTISGGWNSAAFADNPGRVPYQRLFFYEYNWTQAIDANGCALAGLIEQETTAIDPCQTVDAYGHSMGAPVSRAAFQRWGGSPPRVAHFISLAGVNSGTPAAMVAATTPRLTLDSMAFFGTYVMSTVARGPLGNAMSAPSCARAGSTAILEPGMHSLRWHSGWSNTDVNHDCWVVRSAGLLPTLSKEARAVCELEFATNRCGAADSSHPNPLLQALNSRAPPGGVHVATVIAGNHQPDFGPQRLVKDYIQCLFTTAAVPAHDSIVPVRSQEALDWTGAAPLRVRADLNHSHIPSFIEALYEQSDQTFLQAYWQWLHNNEGPYQVEVAVPEDEQATSDSRSLRPPVSTDATKPIVLCPYSEAELEEFPPEFRFPLSGYKPHNEVRLGARVKTAGGTTPSRYRGPLGMAVKSFSHRCSEAPPEDEIASELDAMQPLQITPEERSDCSNDETFGELAYGGPVPDEAVNTCVCSAALGQRRKCRDTTIERSRLKIDAPKYGETGETATITISAPDGFVGTPPNGRVYCFGAITPESCPSNFTAGASFSVQFTSDVGQAWVCAQADEGLCGNCAKIEVCTFTVDVETTVGTPTVCLGGWPTASVSLTCGSAVNPLSWLVDCTTTRGTWEPGSLDTTVSGSHVKMCLDTDGTAEPRFRACNQLTGAPTSCALDDVGCGYVACRAYALEEETFCDPTMPTPSDLALIEGDQFGILDCTNCNSCSCDCCVVGFYEFDICIFNDICIYNCTNCFRDCNSVLTSDCL